MPPSLREVLTGYAEGALSALTLAAHALAAVLVWLLLPGGFPVDHPRFWVNRALPAALLALIAAAIAARWFKRRRAAAALLAAFPAAWAGAAVSARLVFPRSLETLWIVALGVGIGLALAAIGSIRRARAGLSFVPIAVISALIGALVPLSQRAPAPETHPIGSAITKTPDAPTPPNGAIFKLDEDLTVDPVDGSLRATRGVLEVTLWPLLTFEDRSPDGAWTALAPRGAPFRTARALVETSTGVGTARLLYRNDGEAELLFRRHRGEPGRAPIEIEARTHLPRTINAHLTTFSDIEVTGHAALTVAFSPCPENPVEVTYAEYPAGLPLRFAYLDGAGIFHLMDATDADKGPFREIGRGPLLRTDPLVITLLDSGAPFLRLVFHDWAAQASTALSPTAGWGVASNAIQMRRASPRPTAPAFISLSLASTGVGRGWDSVGHAAGVYQNRVTVSDF